MFLSPDQICLIYLISYTGYIRSQINNNLDLEDVKNRIDTIPGLENFGLGDLPTEDLEKLIKEKCIQNGGGEEAFNALKNQREELQSCFEAQLNMTQFQLELEESKETGSMDEVLGKYCRKYPQFLECFESVSDKIKPCLDATEQDTHNKTLQVIDDVKEFLCYRDGDRVALLISEGGIECYESRREGLQECLNETLGSRIPANMSVATLPSLVLTDNECRDFNAIRRCFVAELEKCDNGIPSNIVGAFFKFLNKSLSCNKVVSEPVYNGNNNNSSATIAVSFFVVAISITICKFF